MFIIGILFNAVTVITFPHINVVNWCAPWWDVCDPMDVDNLGISHLLETCKPKDGYFHNSRKNRFVLKHLDQWISAELIDNLYDNVDNEWIVNW